MGLAQSSHTNFQREMIAYNSRSLDPAKKNYKSTEKKCSYIIKIIATIVDKTKRSSTSALTAGSARSTPMFKYSSTRLYMLVLAGSSPALVLVTFLLQLWHQI
jgi:hypothetical protein